MTSIVTTSTISNSVMTIITIISVITSVYLWLGPLGCLALIITPAPYKKPMGFNNKVIRGAIIRQ